MLFIFTFVISLVVTMVLIPPVMKWAVKIGAIDIPDARKVHTQAIPRVGGVAMVISSVVSILIMADLNQQIVAALVGFLVILGFGLWDDKCNLHYKIKFLGQLLATIIVVTWGDVMILTLPFIDVTLPLYISIPFTVFALVGITNAINLSDGLDGLAGGTSLISISIIALLAFDADGETVLLISMAVAGSILGFLRHNTYPANLFMGDTGSQFLGFSLGILVILLSQTVNSAMSPLIPLFILGLPILDTMAVMGQRLYERRSPFSPDKNHIHHKLLDMGFDHYEAVFLIYLFQSALVAITYFMLYASDLLLMLIYILISVLVLGSFHLSKRHKWKLRALNVAKPSFLKRLICFLKSNGCLTTLPTLMIKALISLLFVISAMSAINVEQDITILAGLLFIVLVSYLKLKSSNNISGFVEKAVVYIVSVMAIYLLPVSKDGVENYYIINTLFALLVIAILLKVRFCEERTFKVTPLDYLVIILVIIAPNLPETHFENGVIGEKAIKLLILFYASETVVWLKVSRLNLIRYGTLGALMIIIFRGIV